MTGLGCQGLGFKYVISLKRLTGAEEVGTLSTGMYACGIPWQRQWDVARDESLKSSDLRLQK